VEDFFQEGLLRKYNQQQKLRQELVQIQIKNEARTKVLQE